MFVKYHVSSKMITTCIFNTFESFEENTIYNKIIKILLFKGFMEIRVVGNKTLSNSVKELSFSLLFNGKEKQLTIILNFIQSSRIMETWEAIHYCMYVCIYIYVIL